MPATVLKLTKRNGIAGQVLVRADVRHEGEAPTHVVFSGSAYGGPVVMILASGVQTFVSEPERFGNFSADPLGWARRFLAG